MVYEDRKAFRYSGIKYYGLEQKSNVSPSGSTEVTGQVPILQGMSAILWLFPKLLTLAPFNNPQMSTVIITKISILLVQQQKWIIWRLVKSRYWWRMAPEMAKMRSGFMARITWTVGKVWPIWNNYYHSGNCNYRGDFNHQRCHSRKCCLSIHSWN